MKIGMQEGALTRFESLLLDLPFLAQMRLASSKSLAFLRAWHYLKRAKIEGDYLEFGVWQGRSFILALKAARKFFDPHGRPAPRFFAFDSFQGLPKPHTQQDATAVFAEGEYRAAQDVFARNIRGAARGWQVITVPGFFEQSLTPALLAQHQLRSAAFVHIDCDLYESTLQALRFATPILQTGSVVLFDDWFLSGGDMRRGEAGACAQWLKEQPGLSLVDFDKVGTMGKCFIVNRAQ